MPPWPIAMPSSTAIVLNSRGIAPAARIASATTWPTSRRCTCPGTNSVKWLAAVRMGSRRPPRAPRGARRGELPPAMFLPWVTVRDRSGGMLTELPSAWSKRTLLANQGFSLPGSVCGGTRRQMRERVAGGLVDALDVLLAEPSHARFPALAPQVLAQPRPAEDIDVPDGDHVPRDFGSVDGHGRAHHHRLPHPAGQHVGGALRLPHGVIEPLLLAERPVPQLPVILHPHDQPLVPALGVDREHPGRPDHQGVDLVLAARDEGGVHRAVPGAAELGQLPAG